MQPLSLLGSQHVRPAQQLDTCLLDFREIRFVNPHAADPHHVPAREDQVPCQAHGLTHPTPGTVAQHRISKAPARCEPTPANRLIVGQHTQDQERMPEALATLPYLPEALLIT